MTDWDLEPMPSTSAIRYSRRRWPYKSANLVLLFALGAIMGCTASQPQPPLRQLLPPTPLEITNGTPVRIDPAHPPIVNFEKYPAGSIQAREQGSCMVRLTVGTDGRVQGTKIIISTGIAQLDRACLTAYQDQHFLPAIQDGTLIVSTIDMPVNWRLPNR
jgi:TonB family protein